MESFQKLQSSRHNLCDPDTKIVSNILNITNVLAILHMIITEQLGTEKEQVLKVTKREILEINLVKNKAIKSKMDVTDFIEKITRNKI